MKFPAIKWEKKGLVVTPSPNLWWMRTHAMVPTPIQMDGALYRVYFAGRNDHNQSHIGYAVIDLNNPTKVLEISQEPVFRPGRLGTFDDNGVLPSCLVQNGGEFWLFYIGFKPGGTTRMDLFGGLAISRDGGESFTRWSEAPILERCRVNPFINTAPWVIKQGAHWRIYYVGGVEWLAPDLPRYNIQTGISTDGKIWQRDGTIAIDFTPGETALARPYVIEQDGDYRMWFSSKGPHYLSRYAESKDGINWIRYDDAVSLKPGHGGPDNEMICYSAVVQHNGQHIMFYNGNDYGRNGICLAVEA